MFNMFEMSFNVQKGMYYTDVISTDAYNIYYSDDISSQHCNFAVFSDVIPVDDVYDEVLAHFNKLKRPMVVYVDSNTSSEMKSLIEKKFKVTYSGLWLRYEGGELVFPEESKIDVKTVQTEEELEDFLEVFCNSYSKKFSHYGIDDVTAYVDSMRKNYKNPKYRSFVAYDGKKPVVVATVGVDNGFCLVFNQTTLEGYLNSPFSEAVWCECMKFYKEVGGRSLCTRIINNQSIERWYWNYGFKRVKSVYRLTHDDAYMSSLRKNKCLDAG